MNFFRDEGIVLKKTKLLKQKKLITIFSKNHGKIICVYYGSNSIKSRRLSHLETLNRIRFTVRSSHDYFYLQESEVIYTYEEIKSDEIRLQKAYEILAILNDLIPERVPEERIYDELINNLLNRSMVKSFYTLMNSFYVRMLLILGFIDEKTASVEFFDVYAVIQSITGKNLIRY